MSYQLSIIIPSYNDAEKLNQCLFAISEDVLDNKIEVVVVDDGSVDNTAEIVNKWIKKASFDIKYIYQKNQLQGVARNKGVAEASSEIVAFIGADILIQKWWIKEHLFFHKEYDNEFDIAVGYITWTENLAKDRFRKWLEKTGIMPNFEGLKNYGRTDFWHFYTWNISMKKVVFKKNKFDENIKTYWYEDMIFGYNILNKGGELYFLENAKVFHNHDLTEKDFFPTRMMNIWKSAKYFSKLYPEIKFILTGYKKIIFQILSFSLVIFLLKLFNKEVYWYALSKKYFLWK